MSNFKAKVHQIQFRMGIRPDPAGGAYSAPPDPLVGLKGPTSKGRGGEGGRRGREGWGEERKGREGRKRRGQYPPRILGLEPPLRRSYLKAKK